MRAVLRDTPRFLALLWGRALNVPLGSLGVAIALAVGVLASISLSRIMEATAGTPVPPLDDAYIHFQFARAFARGEPLVYIPGAGPVAGATSVLWPVLLSIPYAFGVGEVKIVYAAWALGFLSLGLLAWEASKTAERFCSPLAASGAAFLVLAFGANTWFAASGMEVVPLSWLLLRAVRRASEWCEGAGEATALRARRRELLLLAFALPLMRPEGSLGSLLIGAAFVLSPRAQSRLWALPALSALAAPALINWFFTGEISQTTAQAKWLPLSPYATIAGLGSALQHYLTLLFEEILDGEAWSALFLPAGSRPILLASLVALPIAAYRARDWARAAFLLVLALGVLLPGTYDCPLCNRLRYLWPFFPAWMVGTAVLAELLGEWIGKRRPELRNTSLLLIGGAAGALAAYLPFSIADLANSSSAILRQQVSLGRWARDALPENARIGVNDAGAIPYFSGRSSFDIVGLTTPREALHWSAGTGSRFEHYERLARSELPTHFIVYPEWFAIPELLGKELTARTVTDATILGGPRMGAYLADYSKLGSAEAPDPALAQGLPLIDRLDVADLQSEAEHDYQLFDAERSENLVLGQGVRLDGARAGRILEAFRLEVQRGGALIVRISTELLTILEIEIDRQRYSAEVAPARWHELRIELSPAQPSGIVPIAIRAQAGAFSALHYFSLGARKEHRSRGPN